MLHARILHFLGFGIWSMMNMGFYFFFLLLHEFVQHLIHNYTSGHITGNPVAFCVYIIPCLSYKATIKSMFDQHGISVKHFRLALMVTLFNFSVFPHSTASSVTSFMSGLVYSFYRLASSDHIVLFNCSPVFSVCGWPIAIFLALSVVLWKCVLGSWDFQ